MHGNCWILLMTSAFMSKINFEAVFFFHVNLDYVNLENIILGIIIDVPVCS